MVLEGDPLTRNLLLEILSSRGCRTLAASTVEQAAELMAGADCALFLAPVEMARRGAIEPILRWCAHPAPLMVLLAEPGRLEAAFAGVVEGAFDLLPKPVTPMAVDALLHKASLWLGQQRAIERLSRIHQGEAQAELIGSSPALENLRRTVRKVAPTDATVLIRGEAGTGKQILARAIHRESPRAGQLFLRIDCAEFTEAQLDQELFGWGDPSSAGLWHAGCFELARAGTVLLENVGQLRASTQAALLRLLQEGEIEAPDGRRKVRAGARLIASSHLDLGQSVARGEFRQDLFHRLNVLPIVVPALRDRGEDIPDLAAHFISQAARRHQVPAPGLSAAFRLALLSYHWPGNVAELRLLLDRAVLLCGRAGELEPGHLHPGHPGQPALLGQASALHPSGPSLLANRGQQEEREGAAGTEIPPLHEIEKRHILRALELCDGNRTRTARQLDISIRTLRNKLHEYHAAVAGP